MCVCIIYYTDIIIIILLLLYRIRNGIKTLARLGATDFDEGRKIYYNIRETTVCTYSTKRRGGYRVGVIIYYIPAAVRDGGYHL